MYLTIEKIFCFLDLNECDLISAAVSGRDSADSILNQQSAESCIRDEEEN